MSVENISPGISDVCFQQFYAIGGSAALLELRVRLLADVTKDIAPTSRSKSISNTESAVLKHFIELGHLSEHESTVLQTARRVRNKFLHGEFREAISLMEGHRKKKFGENGVGVLDVEGMDGDQMFAAIEGVLSGKKRLKRVPETSGSDDFLFGWLIHASAIGVLGEAERLLKTAISIVDRLSRVRFKAGSEEGRIRRS